MSDLTEWLGGIPEPGTSILASSNLQTKAPMNKLKKLVDLCKGEVVVTINGHRSAYEEIQDYLYSPDTGGIRANEETLAEMVKRDQCVEVQFYPDTPVGFIYVAHWDLDAALDEALAYSGFAR